MEALQHAAKGDVTTVRHKLKGGNGQFVDVVTRFYPRGDDETSSSPSSPTLAPKAVGGRALSVIAQISLAPCEPVKQQRRAREASSLVSNITTSAPSISTTTSTLRSTKRSQSAIYLTSTSLTAAHPHSHFQPKHNPVSAPVISTTPASSAVPGSFSFSTVPSTFKNLAAHASSASDNVFDELSGTMGTSWHFELHQRAFSFPALSLLSPSLSSLTHAKDIDSSSRQ